MSDLMPRQTIASLVAAHDAVLAQATQGITAICAATKLMRETCAHRGEVLPSDHRYGYASELANSDPRRALDDCIMSVRESFWRYTLAQTGVEAMMSPDDRDRMRRMFEDHSTPAFDVPTVVSTLQGLAENSGEIFEGAVRAVWELFRPGRGAWNKYRTNEDCSAVQRKVILGWGFCGGGTYLDLGRKQDFNELNKVFHVLDGKGLPKADNNLGCQMEQARREGQDGLETDYFSIKWFKVGTIHVTFKRLDLLAELNRIGGEGEMVLAVKKKRRAA